ncbi:hypothetical protein KP509_03G005000 [Ceratopteris richardii]|nr:hypothetical protein KP509_03G005000 [Ceratopteris richardii]
MMITEGVELSTHIYVALLKTCINMKWIARGYTLHAQIVMENLHLHPFINTTLLHMYFKFGMIVEARDIFDSSQFRDLILWTALITGYVEQDKCQEALDCFDQMQEEGMVPDPVTYVCCLKACAVLGNAAKGMEMHRDVVRLGFDSNRIVGNTLVDMYSRFGMLTDAKEVFEKLPEKDIVSWNTIATGYAENGLGAEVLALLQRMKMEGVEPDTITFVCCLRGCSSMRAIEKGQELHAELVKEGLESDQFVSSTLVDFYVKSEKLEEAREILDGMVMRDIVPWTAMVTGYAEHGCDDEVLDCYSLMQAETGPLTMATISSVIFAYAEQGEAEKTYWQFVHMQEQGLLPNSSIFVGLLVACRNSYTLQLGKIVHALSFRLSFGDIIVATAAINMYASCGSMVHAHTLLNALPFKKVITWNALMTGYAHHGNSKLVFGLLKDMQHELIAPDEITFLNVLSVCSHSGLYNEVLDYLEDMWHRGIYPNVKHYTCLIGLLCRTGQLDEAMAMLNMLPIDTGLMSWHAVLSACYKLGSMKLGKHAFDHVVSMDEDHGAAYILMSNVYSDSEIKDEMK